MTKEEALRICEADIKESPAPIERAWIVAVDTLRESVKSPPPPKRPTLEEMEQALRAIEKATEERGLGIDAMFEGLAADVLRVVREDTIPWLQAISMKSSGHMHPYFTQLAVVARERLDKLGVE